MIVDGIAFINKAYKEGKKILIESANAIMLDIDFGTYPYVTSSSPSIGGACTVCDVTVFFLKAFRDLAFPLVVYKALLEL